MNWMQFVASMASALAWPIAAVWIVFLFRKALTDRIPALLKLNLPGGLSAEFERRVEEVATTTENPDAVAVSDSSEVPARAAGSESSRPNHANDPMQLTELRPLDNIALAANPTGVVMEAWKDLESAIRIAGSRVDRNAYLPKDLGARGVIKYLNSVNFFTPDEVLNLEKLQSLRNMAAHSTEPISSDSANTFADVASSMAARFLARAHERFSGRD